MEIDAGFRSVGHRHLEDVLWLKKFLLGEIYAVDVFHKKWKQHRMYFINKSLESDRSTGDTRTNRPVMFIQISILSPLAISLTLVAQMCCYQLSSQ